MATAARAHFAPDPRRRALIGKVKIAQKEMGLDDDLYRQILFDVTGHVSAAECSERELVAVVDRFKARGWKPKVAAGKVAKARPADHPLAGKARAMWISLHQLAAIRDPSEQALETFACAQLKCDRFQWADQAKGYKLVEALKAMAERAGWSQDLAGVRPIDRALTLRARLNDAILVRLKKINIAARHWTVDDAAWHLCGIDRALGSDAYEGDRQSRVAAALGLKLRAARGVAEVAQ
jgi:phage gp16-like protein